MVRAVADRDPPRRVVFLPARAQPGTVHHIPRYLGPFAVGEHPVLGGGAHRAVPDRLGIPPLAERVVREPQKPGQAAEVPAAAGAQRGLKVTGRAVAGDDMRIGMFFPPSWAVQVADQPGHVLAARADLPDHRSPAPGHHSRPAERHPPGSGTTRNAIRAGADRRGTWPAHPGPADGGADRGPAAGPRGPDARMARRNLVRRSSPATSSRAARRTLSSAYRERSPDHCPVAFSFATA